MNLLIVSCPTCSFQLMVADRDLLGRPARCPQCRTKFVLEEQEQPEDSASIIESICSIGSIGFDDSTDGVLDPRKLRAEDGRTCITIEQLKTCHSNDEADHFLRWLDQSGKTMPRLKQCFFLSDYAEWCEIEMPDDAG